MSGPSVTREFWEGVSFSGRFFMGDSPVHAALTALVQLLESEKVPYAVVGAMALNAYGYRRVTTNVDVLLNRDGLERFKKVALGRGYVEKFAGSKGVRDTVNSVGIDVLLAGEFPGDGKPKAVVFPDPAATPTTSAEVSAAGSERREMQLLPRERLIELKLASGLSAAHRLKDLADVLELIKAAKLPLSIETQVDASVRAKYVELWHAAQVKDAISEE